jgi:hypothetical protein
MKTPRLFLVRLYVRPRQRSKFAKKYGGAFVNCLVDFPIARSAEVVAKDWINRTGWDVKRKVVIKIVTRKDYKGHKQLESYFDEALKFGVSAAFYCHPPEKPIRRKRT